jgi:hypothetical protein
LLERYGIQTVLKALDEPIMGQKYTDIDVEGLMTAIFIVSVHAQQARDAAIAGEKCLLATQHVELCLARLKEAPTEH